MSFLNSGQREMSMRSELEKEVPESSLDLTGGRKSVSGSVNLGKE